MIEIGSQDAEMTHLCRTAIPMIVIEMAYRMDLRKELRDNQQSDEQ